MKYTSLFSAVAIAAAMGTQALATVDTNNTTKIDFESLNVGLVNTGTIFDGTWSVTNEDASAVVYGPLSCATDAEVESGYTANKHLRLNTEGHELTWTPSNMSTNKAIIEMKVRLVASESAPVISDGDVHAAVYLQVSDPVDATKDGLYAYSRVSGEDTWSKLNTTGFNHDLATGDMVALRVIMDYGTQKATYEGALLADAENDVPVYVELGEKDMAHPDNAATQGQLASISFKGTGGIDDLFVGEIVETPSTASVTLQQYTAGEWTDVEDGKVDTVNPDLGFETVVQVPQGKVAVVTVCDDEGTVLATLSSDVIDEFGQLTVSCNDFAFEAEKDYLIRVQFTDPGSDLEAFAIGDAVTQAALATAGVAPVEVDGDYFIVNVIEPAGATASLLGSSTLGGDFTAVTATRTVKNGYTELKYAIPANETAKFFKVKFTK